MVVIRTGEPRVPCSSNEADRLRSVPFTPNANINKALALPTDQPNDADTPHPSHLIHACAPSSYAECN
jgi:hypothetical protein